MAQEKNPLDKISKKDKVRLSKLAYLLSSRGRWLQWCSAFNKYEITAHPSVRGVKILSFAQSARFALSLHSGEVFIGVQRQEMAWLKDMPLERVTIDDMLYLTSSACEGINLKFGLVTIGIRLVHPGLVSEIRKYDYVRFVEVRVEGGKVIWVGEEFREPVMLCTSKIADSLTSIHEEEQMVRKTISFL